MPDGDVQRRGLVTSAMAVVCRARKYQSLAKYRVRRGAMDRGSLDDTFGAGVLQACLHVRVYRPLVCPPQVLAPYHCEEQKFQDYKMERVHWIVHLRINFIAILSRCKRFLLLCHLRFYSLNRCIYWKSSVCQWKSHALRLNANDCREFLKTRSLAFLEIPRVFWTYDFLKCCTL